MTLWAVEVSGGNVATQFPTRSRAMAVESAGRINDWVAYMNREHPGAVGGVMAEVIEWPHSAQRHAIELAQSEAYMAEEQQEI